MKYAGLWHGGSSYAPGGPEDAETFRSIRQAGQTLQARDDNDDGRTPCSGGGSMHLWRILPGDDDGAETVAQGLENGPDIVLEMGPRGGVRRG